MLNRIIAIIDEDESMLGKLEEILSMGGYAPVPVIDPLSAVDTIVQNKPDVILMELGIFKRIGFEFTHAIDQVFETKRVPIIAMSDKDEFRWLLDSCGIKKLIKKPVHPLDLIWAIENEIGEKNVKTPS